MKLRILAALSLNVFSLVLVIPAQGELPPGTYTLPSIPLGEFQNSILPGSIDNDRKILLGGIGSSLFHDRKDPDDLFWMVTDRGPNGDATVVLPDGSSLDVKTFAVPSFNPTILKVQARNGVLEILDAVPVLRRDGKAVTGLPNAAGYDDPGYDWNALNPLAFNPDGMDTEGLVLGLGADFWLCEEYAPSIVHIGPNGKVLKRYLPINYPLDASAFGYPVAKVLPTILLKRKVNRGFEGIALSPDGRTLFVALQSPLLNPDRTVGNASRNLRILAFDTSRDRVVAEYVYQFQPAGEFAASDNLKPKSSDLKVSELVAVNSSQLLVDERTDFVAKLFIVRLETATDILGTKWDDPGQSPSLESLADPATEGIAVSPKVLVVNLDAIAGMPNKIEGVSFVKQPFAIAVANDNDFGIGAFDPVTGDLIDTGVSSQLIVFDFDLLPGGGGISVPGDIDGDGDLDLGDLEVLVKAIGKFYGDSGFVLAADLDDDFAITQDDYRLWLRLFRAERKSG